MMDPRNDLGQVVALKPAELGGGTTQGEPIDLKDYLSASIAVLLGTPGITLDATDKFELMLRHADEDPGNPGNPGAFDIVPKEYAHSVDEMVAGVWKTLDDNALEGKAFVIGYKMIKRFIRCDVVGQGTHGVATPISAIAILGNRRKLPVEND